MLGAIKRRWKSKKAKVLHKGGELPSSHDTCTASRGFADEDFDKIIKPPSPRQIHPVSELTMEPVSTKYTNSPHPHHHKSGGPTAKIKSSTLPSTEGPCPFIRVNSGRIELVNSSGHDNDRHGSPHYHLPRPPFPEILSEKLRRRLGGRLRNDSRHSWCGGSRDGPGRLRGSSGLVLSTQPPPPQDQAQFPGSEKQRFNLNSTEVDPTYSDPIEENQIIRLRTSLLQERLDVLETITKNCQNWQKEEKKETEAWITDLTSQVTRAFTFQQVMKSEVEKLQERVLDLESHNRAMAKMIVPTLMKLEETLGTTRLTEVGRGSEIPESSLIKIKTKTMAESWSPTTSSTTTTSSHGSKGLKEKKIDCRIPRISYKLNRTKHQEQNRADRGGCSGGDSSSSPDLTPPPTTVNSRLGSLPCKVMPKSKSSLTTSTHSKSPIVTQPGPGQNKSSTFSGIPRMASPRPTTPGEKKGKASSSPPGSGGGGAGNHKNDSPKTPSHDLHNTSANGGSGGSRLPILRKNVFPSQSPKTNPGKVTSVIHHQVGTSGSNKNSIPHQTSSGLTVPGLGKPLGKDEGYSTMSSEALAEQEGSNSIVTNDKDITTTIPKSNTFSTFHDHNLAPAVAIVNGSSTRGGGGPLPKQLIMMGRERNWTSLPKSAAATSSPPPGLVRIVRGISGAVSYEIEAHLDDEGENGGRLMTMEEPTVLWEDSDDSDILFLPLELSTTSPGSSSPTLVPASWPSSTTPRLPSSTSFSNSSTVTNGSMQEQSHRKPLPTWTDPPPSEEKALIEKWMRLEDGRNQVHWEDEWAWDWDGVERIAVQKTLGTKKFNPDLRLPEFWTYSEDPEPDEPKSIQIDSSTWTKSKKKSNLITEIPQNSTSIDLVSQIETDVTPILNKPETPPSPPPVIDFTPAYYHLVKYGSSSSMNDNQQLITKSVPTHASGPVRPTKTTEFTSFSSSDEEGCNGKMDDKISQTDFGSSLENLSVSSELFTECRNCLELIKRLVGGIDETYGSSIPQDDKSLRNDNLMTTLDRNRDNRLDETILTDQGQPTTWISVPKGLPTAEVDRILEILSSSESEDVLSPQSSTTSREGK